MTVGECLDDFDAKLENNEVRKMRFKVRFTRDDQEDIMSYNEIVDFMTRETNEENGEYWKFRKIIGHEKVDQYHKNYNGSSYNLRIAWENGEVSEVPLKLFAQDAQVECAIYAKENDLLDTPGWKRFRRTAKRSVKLVRMINQVRLRQFRSSPKYMFGYQVPKTLKQAKKFDALAGNHKWEDSNELEHEQLRDYETFIDQGIFNESKIPRGYKKISVHAIFSVNTMVDSKLVLLPMDTSLTPPYIVYTLVLSH